MLDFQKLRTPPEHGDVLVEPAPSAMRAALLGNASALKRLDITLAGRPLREYRRQLRTVLAGDEDRPVVMVGHQPEFLHPGVWAKHVVGARLAEAVGGTAVDLIVDSDVPKQQTLAVPGVKDGEIRLGSVRFLDAPPGVPFERFAAYGPSDVARLRRQISGMMGERFAASLMPEFLDGLNHAPQARDWVDQMVFARKAIERSLGVELTDHRVSDAAAGPGFGPLLAEMIGNAHRFAACYNAALADYRRAYHVRSPQRPIPDLAVEGARCEVAAWVYDEAGRRHRLYVGRVCDTVRLFSDAGPLGEFSADALGRWDRAEPVLVAIEGWRCRPRALTLTLWARLCLADLFIHGIGGAKYDRITDRLIAGYFGVAPPTMGCVSATLRLDLPHRHVNLGMIRKAERRLRDLRYNPQRHLNGGQELSLLASRRSTAVAASIRLRREDRRNREARRRVFEEIRAVSQQMLAVRPETATGYEAALADVRRRRAQSEIARRRDYFFGLFSREQLGLLLDRLPATADFRV